MPACFFGKCSWASVLQFAYTFYARTWGVRHVCVPAPSLPTLGGQQKEQSNLESTFVDIQ
eukprot:1151886-Pelagomonas_calceolata.AAC.3